MWCACRRSRDLARPATFSHHMPRVNRWVDGGEGIRPTVLGSAGTVSRLGIVCPGPRRSPLQLARRCDRSPPAHGGPHAGARRLPARPFLTTNRCGRGSRRRTRQSRASVPADSGSFRRPAACSYGHDGIRNQCDSFQSTIRLVGLTVLRFEAWPEGALCGRPGRTARWWIVFRPW